MSTISVGSYNTSLCANVILGLLSRIFSIWRCTAKVIVVAFFICAVLVAGYSQCGRYTPFYTLKFFFTTVCITVRDDAICTVAMRPLIIITFCVSGRRRKMYCGYARLCDCVCVCLSVRGRTPTLLHGPGCNLGAW